GGSQGVDQEARAVLVGSARDAGRAAVVEQDAIDLAALADLGAAGARVVEQQRIELRPLDEQRVWVDVERAEVDAPRSAIAAPHEGLAALRLEARALDLLAEAERVQVGQDSRQQRLADVLAGELLSLDQQDSAAGARELGRGARTRWAGADDDRVPG